MLIKRIAAATRVLGKAQGFLGLPVRDEDIDGMAVMTTAWEPTPDEIERISRGAAVYIRLGGSMHPPIRVDVEDPQTKDPAEDVA